MYLLICLSQWAAAQNSASNSKDLVQDSLISNSKSFAGNIQNAFEIKTAVRQIIDLNKHVQILKEEKPNGTPGVLASEKFNLFKFYTRDSINCSNCIYWSKIEIKNETTPKQNDWILYLGNASYFDAYIYNPSQGQISYQKTGRLVPANQKNLIYGNRLARIKLDFTEYDHLIVLFRVENASGYLPSIQLELSPEDFNSGVEFSNVRIFDGLFIGFLIAIILFNLIYFFTTKDIAFFYQFLFVSGVLVFMLDVMNVICDIPVLRNHPKLFEPINFAALILLNIAYLQFVNKFIQLDKVFPKWIGIIKNLIAMNLVIGAIIIIYYFITLNERITDTSIAVLSTLQYAILLILLFQLIKIKDKKSYFILIATFFLIAGVIVGGIFVAIGVGVPIHFSKFVILGNVSFFFFGLAYRMKLLKEEEHEAIRLKENQELRNRLYANITHEFRTPLTVIQGMAQQIETSIKIQESSKIQNAIQLIKSNGNRLLKLVNTILDLAKLESGRMTLMPSHSDIIGFLRYSIQLFESYASSKKIYVQFLTDLDVLEMDFDKEKMQQIISNLLSNAIKFTPAGGRIFFSVKKLEKNRLHVLQVQVKDTGEGIPESELGNVFDRFFQVESSKNKLQGSGLGLALVYELVQLMEGEITVESELGKGTTFTILLPVKTYDQVVHSEEKSNDVNEDLIRQDYDAVSTGARMESIEFENELFEVELPGQEISNTEKPLLLIVDDNQDIIYYLHTLLEKDYTIETAYNGKDGITLAMEIIPDIIISDVLMPEKDGYELCELLKHEILTSHIPIILLTAKSDSASKVSGIKKGADAYLSKPFDEAELKAQLQNLLDIRKSLQKHYKVIEDNSDSLGGVKLVEDAFLVKLNNLIHDNMEDEDFGILQLCRAMQMSRTQLHRKITALTGKSTSIYIRYLRLQQAKQLLRKPEMNISEVAFAVGFSDPNYFTRTFTEEFGMTPSGFRAER